MIKYFIYKITANKTSQEYLLRLIKVLLKLTGIGKGSDVNLSGEKYIIDLMKNIIKPPYVILDVGSNIGQFIEIILDHIKLPDTDFIIHSFEPSKKAFSILESKFTNHKNIILNRMGLSDKITEQPLFYDIECSGIASLFTRKLEHFRIHFDKEEIIELTTIDHYCIHNNIKKISLLKIDAEGNEFNILIGVKEMLEKKRIDIISFVFGGCNIDSKIFFQDLFYLLNTHKMAIFRLTPTGYLHPILDYSEINEIFLTTNYIALKNELLFHNEKLI